MVLKNLINKMLLSTIRWHFGWFKLFMSLFVISSLNIPISAQDAATIKTFRQLNTAEQRIAFLSHNTVEKMDKPTFEAILIEIKSNKKNDKLLYLWHYRHMSFALHFDDFTVDEFPQILDEMIKVAKEGGLKAELVLANFCKSQSQFGNKTINEQRVYTDYLLYFEQIKALGTEAFKDYDLPSVLHEIGRNFYELGDEEKALECLLIAEKIVLKGTHVETLILNLIESIYAHKKEYPKAIAYAQKIYNTNSNSIIPITNDNSWIPIFWKGLASLDIAQYMLEMGNIKDAEGYAERGYQLHSSGSDLSSNQGKVLAEFEALLVIIKIKLLLGKLDEAELLFKRVEYLKSRIDFNNDTYYFKPLKLYKNYTKYYEAKKDYTNAFRYMKLATEMQDSLNRRNDKRKLWQTEMRVKVDSYQKQIKLVEDENTWQTRLTYLVILMLLIILVASFVVYRVIKKDNKIINEQKTLLEKSLEEKENLLKEIHHRVKNNLQIISGLFDKQARLATDEQTKKLMREGQDRVFSIALVHENLYQSENLTTIRMKTYLEMLTQNIENSHKNEHQTIKLSLDVDDSILEIDTAIPLGLILNELITNCFKYAFKNRTFGEIYIRFHQKENEFVLSVQDNGIGLSADFDVSKTKTLGMNLIRGLVRQISGKLDFSTNNEGTTFSVIA